MMKIRTNNKGISLIELVISLAIFAIVIQVAYSIFFVGNKSFAISKERGFAQQEMRIVATALNNQIRMSKEVSLTDLGEKFILIEDVDDGGNTVSMITINGAEYGPFNETHFIVNTSTHSLVLQISSIDFPALDENITVRFENWDSFINKTQFNDITTGDPIEFKELFYSKY